MRQNLARSDPDRMPDSDPESEAAATESARPRRRSRRRIVLAWTWVALWAGIIWILGGDDFSYQDTSSTLSPWLKWLIGDVDYRTRIKIFVAVRKSAHFVEYAILALLTFRAALMAARRNQWITAAWVALFLVATLASADEARQAFSSARTGSPFDVLIDITGGVIAIGGLLLISRRMRPGAPTEPDLVSGTFRAP
jgi:hypothetical protein